jgi:hypothetical protein
VHEAPPKRNLGLEIAAGIEFFAAVAVLLIATLRWHQPYDLDHLTTEGIVSDSRIVIDHIRDNPYGGLIYYRTEALVTYEIDGQAQNRWLIASEITTERVRLASKLADSPKICQVYWLPDHPENARCRFR